MALESLPQDVRVCVFEHLDSAASLVNLALPGPKLYAEVKDSQHSSIPRILARKFPRSVLHDAIFTWEAARRESSSQEATAQFLQRYARKETGPELARLTISDALSIESLCRTVDYFIDSLVRSAMDVASQRYECDTDSVISEAERARTTRALLRFELYRRAFYQSGAHTPSTSEQRMLFWNYFAPWEQEQMACVHDHLCNRIFTVCQDLADHVPGWTGFYAITGLGIDMIRPWLSLGTITLHAILTADIATRRQKSFLDPTRLNYFQPLISDGLLGASDPSANTLATMDPTEDRRVIHPAFTAPDDPGPETAWRWAHQREKPWREEDGGDGFVLAPRQTPLRACGYVFWDARRLQAWGMLRGAWEGPDPDALEAAREEGEEAGKAWLEARAEELAARGVIARGLGLR